MGMLIELETLLVVGLEMLVCEVSVQSMDEVLSEVLADVAEFDVAKGTLLTEVTFAGS